MHCRMYNGLVTKKFKWDPEESKQVQGAVKMSWDDVQPFKCSWAASLGHYLNLDMGEDFR